tara:strand:- start:81 stop:491 length:411 start_codon:yes stop_codon:yes gene_type:complete
MEIAINRTNDKFHFEASNGGATLPIGASPVLGDTEYGFRPMELMLVSLGSCMSIDVLNLLYKQRQQVEDYDVKVSATRKGEPSIFENILVEIFVKGQVEEKRLEKAIAQSRDKYCSAYKVLNATATIDIKYYLNEV